MLDDAVKLDNLSPDVTVLGAALAQGDGTQTTVYYPSVKGVDITHIRRAWVGIDAALGGGKTIATMNLEVALGDTRNFYALVNPDAPGTALDLLGGSAPAAIAKKAFPLGLTVVGSNPLDVSAVLVAKRFRIAVNLSAAADTGDIISMVACGV